ncbi:MAG TPA: hypothetical protein VKX25_11665 [Bryobacteraceae bacterium]|jgi:hypothetical protein|nr:hypothetical protein [Bryobacteraceae bacterium]
MPAVRTFVFSGPECERWHDIVDEQRRIPTLRTDAEDSDDELA